MKSLKLALLALFISPILHAQQIEFSAGLGGGAVYIVESLQDGGVNYGLPLSCYADLTFRFPESYFDLKLRGQYIYCNIGEYGQNQTVSLYDRVTSFTTYALLEHVNTEKKWALGYSIGAGYCSEYVKSLNFFSSNGYDERHFINFYLSGIGSLKTSDRITLTLEPAFIWNDVASTLIGNWRSAGEDINLLLQIGFRYRLK